MISRSSIGDVYPVKRLSEVVEFLDSKRRPVTESDRRAGPYPYFGANGQQGTIDDFIFDEPLVLLAEDGGYFDDPNRGIAYRISGKTWVNNHAHVLRPNPHVDLAFLCRVLENYDVTPFVTGTTRGKLTKAGASEIVLPLPPMAEQRRIAEILDKAEALRAKRRSALRQLGTLTQSIFLDLFGDPASNPKGWPKVLLGELAPYISSGVTPLGGSTVYQESGVLFIRSQNVLMNAFDFSDIAYVSDDLHRKMRRTWVKNGDVLINITGASIGRVHYFNGSDDTANVNQHVCIIRLDRARVIPEFVSHYLSKPTYQRIILGRNAGATRQAFNFEQIRQFSIALPPLSLQREFSSRIAAVENLKTAHRASLTKLDALFTSLQHRAFRGEL